MALLATKTAVITGGAQGIGLAIAQRYVAEGARVVLGDLDEAAAQAAAKELGGDDVALGVRCDVTSADDVQSLLTAAQDAFGSLDVMVNNAGIGVGGEMAELSLAHWDRAIDVNLRGVVHGVHAAFPVMVRQRSGHIVNTASLAGLVPAALLTPYVMTKHAVVGLSLALRPEAASHGIRVTAVCPGFTDTPILDKAGPEDLPKPALAERGRDLATKAQRHLYDADLLAVDILRGMDRNKALVVAPRSARVAWRAIRLAPGLSSAVGRLEMRYVRRHR